VGSIYDEKGATATDEKDGDVSGGITIDTTAVDTSRAGSFKVWYSVTDSEGNEARKSRTVIVNPLVSAPSSISHRYSFTGTGTTVTDLLGNANGSILGGSTMNDSGSLTLDGVNDYVDLPDGIISELEDATFETWVTWGGPANSQWQRVFDFGENTSNYIYLTTLSSSSTLPVRFAVARNTIEEKTGGAVTVPFDGTTPTHFAITHDNNANKVTLYVDGQIRGSMTTTNSLSELNDVNNWLGRSQFTNLPYFKGVYHEFRIYKTALSSAEIQMGFQNGPDKATGPIIAAFTSKTPKITNGSLATLTWDITSATHISIDQGVGDVSNLTELEIQPAATTTYHITASNGSGSATIPFTVIVDSGDDPTDLDGDGWTNDQEDFLGTNPLDPTDSFQVQLISETSFGNPEDQVVYKLQWNSVVGRTYTIESSSDLKSWTLVTLLAGDGRKLLHTVRNANAIGFFRMRIE